MCSDAACIRRIIEDDITLELLKEDCRSLVLAIAGIRIHLSTALHVVDTTNADDLLATMLGVMDICDHYVETVELPATT